MPKGVKRELNLGEEIMDLDRVLLVSIRRNLSVARRFAQESTDPVLKATLEKFLGKHILTPKDVALENPEPIVPMTEKDKKVYRLNRYLSILSDADVQNLLELTKSMYRMRKVSDNTAADADLVDPKEPVI
jgi:hypothetical protein